jgi:hypothetical protein
MMAFVIASTADVVELENMTEMKVVMRIDPIMP